ncbi:hypothetical protein [uncultured Polaribacter sp.]|uniref:hypothetical protein n=1 Tax=uncultured Polaribacter sp. TaxID=174711 RepID=UPI0030DA91F0
MIRIYIFIYFILVFSNSLQSQSINGILKDTNNKNITTSSNIILKDLLTNEILDFKVVYDGRFTFKIKKTYKNLLLETKVFGYQNYEQKIENINSNKQYDLELILIKDAITSLDEVIVTSKKRFEIKKDTIVYNIDAYKDGSERKVIDIIKKLPGIEVNNNSGKIKYNGKFIETVLLEGDNLFDENYTIGTKNINIDIIKGIEAIDKYSKNPLLKGIENSDKVVLNLLLKNNKIDLSGSSDIKLGMFSDKIASNLNTNFIGITKKNKNFSTFSYNNVGDNLTPFNYSDSSINMENYTDENFKIHKVIPEFSINNEKSNINNQLFTNINNLVTLNNKAKLKINLYYLEDKITNNQFITNNFSFNNTNFTTFDSIAIYKKPTQIRTDFNINYLLTKNSNLEYDFSLTSEEITTSNTINSNNNNQFNSLLNSNDLIFKQALVYTKKVLDNKAYQLKIKNIVQNLDQNYNLTTSNNLNFQDIKSSKIHTDINGLLFGRDKKNNKYKFVFGSLLNNTDFNSSLNHAKSENINDVTYFKSKLYTSVNYSFNQGNWTFTPKIYLNLVSQKLENYADESKLNQTNLIVNPSFETNYKINRVSFIVSKIYVENSTNVEDYLFPNQILINNRVTKTNKPDLSLQKSQNLSMYYFNNNLYDQFQMNLGINANRVKGNFFSNSTINEDTMQLSYFFLPEYNSIYSLNFNISKYLPFIESTLKFSSNYSIYNFKNIVNNSSLRENTNKGLNLNLFAKTAFDGIFNFQNDFSYTSTLSENNTNNSIFNNAFINNTFKTIITPTNKLFSEISYNFFYPNLKNATNYNFIDFNLRYKTRDYNIGLVVKNILNENSFQDVQVTDYATTIFRSSILPRHFLIDFSINF